MGPLDILNCVAFLVPPFCCPLAVLFTPQVSELDSNEIYAVISYRENKAPKYSHNTLNHETMKISNSENFPSYIVQYILPTLGTAAWNKKSVKGIGVELVAVRVIRYTVLSRESLSKLNFTSSPFFSKAVMLGIPSECTRTT